MNLKEYSKISNAVDNYSDRLDENALDTIKQTIAKVHDKLSGEMAKVKGATLKMNLKAYGEELKAEFDVYFGRRKATEEDLANVPALKKILQEVCGNIGWEEQDED